MDYDTEPHPQFYTNLEGGASSGEVRVLSEGCRLLHVNIFFLRDNSSTSAGLQTQTRALCGETPLWL